MSWQDRTQVKKGNLGESIVDQLAIQKGYVPFTALPTYDGPHAFDRVMVRQDKTGLFLLEVKTKPARKYYPDTGFDYKNYLEYKAIEKKHNLRVFVAFVDEARGEIYGNWLSELERPVYESYPIINGKVIYFPLAHMKTLGKISKEKCEELRALSTRNKAYDGV
jgi:hypothetical protein